jgi:5-formyltetrahydrofolate cyclo-ligase
VDLKLQKRDLRRDLRQRILQTPPAEWDEGSAAVRARLEALPEWKAATRVLGFAPMSAEIDIWPALAGALAQGKTVALPRYDSQTDAYVAVRVLDLERDIVSGAFGLREPAPGCPLWPWNQLDFVLVPGLGFDPGGRRLGRGKGFYDRMLSAATGVFCGVSMDWQLVPAIPAEAHDVLVDCILTPTRCWQCQPRRDGK